MRGKRENYDIQKTLNDYVKDYPDKEIKIINAAINAFSEKGFENTKTKEIAERAGIAEGTIFRYFPSKESILERMVPLLIKIMQPKLEKPIQNIIRDTESAPVGVVFSAILVDRLKIIRDNQRFLVSVLPELIHRAPLRRQLAQRIFPMIERYIAQVLQAAKQRGEVAKETDTRIVMYQLMGFVFSYSLIGGDTDEENLMNDVDTFMQYAMEGWAK
jgi:AcrR family transcriptional regulator